MADDDKDGGTGRGRWSTRSVAADNEEEHTDFVNTPATTVNHVQK